jgi:hypothetical protein
MVQNKATSFRFKPDIRELLERLCELERRDRTNMISIALIEYAKHRGTDLPADESNKVFDIIAKAGKDGLTQSELTRKTQFLTRRTRESTIADLVGAGLVLVEQINVRGKVANRYRKGN